jgi:nucleotide-binding universal stress UspA family protein
MSFATLMVYVDVEPKSDTRVRLAAKLADRFASTLIGISACMLPAFPAEGDFLVTAEFVEQQLKDIREALKRTEVAFRMAAGANGLRLEWRSEIGLPEDYLASEARAADLVIIGRNSTRDVSLSLDAGAAVLKTGRPILAVPPGVDVLSAERIVIGWKDTREARRALQDSLPLLHKAKSVLVVEVCDAGMETASRKHLDDVVHYLAQHRIPASAITTPAKDGIANELIRRSQTENADLIVAGAYGHTRLGEWIFGGVTRDLLTSSPVCCLLAH